MSIKIENLPAISEISSSDLMMITDVDNSNLSKKATIGAILSPVSAIISSNGQSLTTTPSIYWVNSTGGSPYSVNLPDPSLMTNRTITFITYGYSESTFTILPYSGETIQGDSSYGMNGPGASVTMLCDGTNWYITASASNF